MDKKGFYELLNITKSDLTSLHHILTELFEEETRKMQGKKIVFFCFSGIWKEFLLLIASSASASWLMRPAVIPAVQHLIGTRVYTRSHHELIADYCPALAFLLVRTKLGKVSDALAELLEVMVTVVLRIHPEVQLSPFDPADKSYISVSLLTPSSNKSVVESDSWISQLKQVREQIQKKHVPFTTTFDPSTLSSKYTVLPKPDPRLSGTMWHWDKIRELPRWEGLDNVKNGAEWSDATNDEEEKNIFCLKEEVKGYAGKKHTAGLFCACCPHGIGYGFLMMLKPEGRKEVLKVLYEYIPKEVLDQLVVVYDFNCQEGEYMLNRCPQLFDHTRLFIDRWHSKTHKCPSAFKLDAYPKFQELVSTANESMNSVLQRLHSQTPFMSQELYVDVVGGIMGVRNALFNAKHLQLEKLYE